VGLKKSRTLILLFRLTAITFIAAAIGVAVITTTIIVVAAILIFDIVHIILFLITVNNNCAKLTGKLLKDADF
jgi:hypothetical protein